MTMPNSQCMRYVLMSMKMMWITCCMNVCMYVDVWSYQILIQLNTTVDWWVSALHSYNYNTKSVNIFWKNVVPSVPENFIDLEIQCQTHWSCSGSRMWHSTLIRHSVLLFCVFFSFNLSAIYAQVVIYVIIYPIALIQCKTSIKWRWISTWQSGW